MRNLCLPWKTECALKIFTALKQGFWGTCACSENRVFPESFHCIEYSFYIQDFWATCAFPENRVPWILCIEYIFFITQNFEQPALALKTEFALKFSSWRHWATCTPTGWRKCMASFNPINKYATCAPTCHRLRSDKACPDVSVYIHPIADRDFDIGITEDDATFWPYFYVKGVELAHFRHRNPITEDDATKYSRDSRQRRFCPSPLLALYDLFWTWKKWSFRLVLTPHLDPYWICRVSILKKRRKSICTKPLICVGVRFSLRKMDERFHHPFTCVVAGPTNCGKTEFVTKFIQHVKQMMIGLLAPQRIVWCYGEWQRRFDSIPNVEFIEGLPQRENFDRTQSTLLILDDLRNETNRSVTDLFTKGSRHGDFSVVYIVQNQFNNGKEHRTINLIVITLWCLKSPATHRKSFKTSLPGKGQSCSRNKTQHQRLSVIYCWTSSSAHLTTSVFVKKFFQTRRQWFTYLVESNDVAVGTSCIDDQTSFPVSSEISDLRNFWFHTMYACTEQYSTYQIRWENRLLGLRNSCLGKSVGLGCELGWKKEK